MSLFRSPRRFVPVVLAVGLVGAACGDEAGGVEADDAWARPSPAMADAGAAYMTLSSDEAVSIVSAAGPSDVVGRVELHETVPVEMEDHSTDDESMDDESMDEGSMDDESMEDDGQSTDMAMTMQQVDSVDIPAGGSVAFEPGGLHVMLLDLPDPLEIGETFDLTLTTADGVEIIVPVEVRTEAP